MFRFLLGVAVGMTAAAMYRQSQSTRRFATRGDVGRVDEVSTAANHPRADTGSLNTVDGTPSDRPTSAWRGFPSSAGDGRNQNAGRAEPATAQPSDTFNAT